MKQIFILIIVMVSFFGCNKSEDATKLISYLPVETYDVYGTLLYPLSSINIVVSATDTSLNCKAAQLLDLDSIGITAEVIQSCILQNKTAFYFENGKLENGGLTLVAPEEIENAESITQILSKYGAISMFKFGLPVYFKNGDLECAMFEMSRSCGPWCGDGSMVVVSKVDGVWGNKRFFGTWISK